MIATITLDIHKVTRFDNSHRLRTRIGNFTLCTGNVIMNTEIVKFAGYPVIIQVILGPSDVIALECDFSSGNTVMSLSAIQNM